MHMRRAAALFLPLLALAAPLSAWDSTGHEVIARIAWEHMTPQARRAAEALLRRAPDESDLLRLALPGSDPASSGRALFTVAATWPDVVRDRTNLPRFEKYAHSTWHYINYFFRATPGGAQDLAQPAPDSVNAVAELTRLSAELGDSRVPAPQRAIDLAWVLHLAGDIHQPMHAESRVTDLLTAGDQGGNLYKLEATHNLHGYWDSAISRQFPERAGESAAARIDRIASTLMARQPSRHFRAHLEPGRFTTWARQSYAIAKRSYGTPEGQEPGPAYRDATFAAADRQVALAGYRLAELLNRKLGR